MFENKVHKSDLTALLNAGKKRRHEAFCISGPELPELSLVGTRVASDRVFPPELLETKFPAHWLGLIFPPALPETEFPAHWLGELGSRLTAIRVLVLRSPGPSASPESTTYPTTNFFLNYLPSEPTFTISTLVEGCKVWWHFTNQGGGVFSESMHNFSGAFKACFRIGVRYIEHRP